MQYEIEAGGRTRLVTVRREGTGFAVTVDGHTRQVDAARVDGHTLSLILDTVWSKEAVVSTGPAAGQMTIAVDDARVPIVLNGRRRGSRDGTGHVGSVHGTGSHGATTSQGPERVTAPMPGKIVRVLVGGGDLVTARQPLVVVEAMKMENEVRAGRDGTVAEVLAREGQLVDAGALLVVINPGAAAPRSLP